MHKFNFSLLFSKFSALATLTIFPCIILLTACASSKVEPISSKNVTFVDTSISEDGKLYTTCLFSKITSLSKLPNTMLSEKDFSYDLKSGEIFLKKKLKIDSSVVLHVEGCYKNPPEFVLAGNVCEKPLVMFNGKRLSCGTDYDFDSTISKISLKSEYDLNEASFSIRWYTSKRECSLENEYDKFKEFYNNTLSIWYKEME